MSQQNAQNIQLIRDFYSAFQRLDWQAMRACYHPEAVFSDPLFNSLDNKAAGDMWHMLCAGAKQFELQFEHIQADDTHGSASWQAKYLYTAGAKVAGRRVNNRVFAEFQFADGRIIRHSDHFSLWRWSAQALGPVGAILGWSGWFRRRLQSRAARALLVFRRRLNDAPTGSAEHTS